MYMRLSVVFYLRIVMFEIRLSYLVQLLMQSSRRQVLLTSVQAEITAITPATKLPIYFSYQSDKFSNFPSTCSQQNFLSYQSSLHQPNHLLILSHNQNTISQCPSQKLIQILIFVYFRVKFYTLYYWDVWKGCCGRSMQFLGWRDVVGDRQITRKQNQAYILNIQQSLPKQRQILQSQMSNYERILSQFRKLGYNQESYLQENQILRSLDSISSQNAGIQEFDRNIAEQLWLHCHPDSIKGAKLKSFINTVMQAQNILRQQITITEGALKMENRVMEKKQLQEQYNQIIYDHNMIASPFRLPPLRQASGQMQQTSKLLQSQKSAIGSQRQGDSIIFSYEPNTREQSSTDLKICLFISIFMLITELVLMFQKHHFLNLLCIFAVLSIFFLNYFDQNYMKFLLILLATSFIFDIVWLGVNAREYWKPDAETQRSTLHSGFLVFVWLMVIILMVLKIVVFGILFKYRDNPESFKKNISLFGYKIKLDGRPTYNPFTPLLRAAPYVGIN